VSDLTSAAREEGARLLQAGDLEGAVLQLQQAVRENPADARAFGLLGIASARHGDHATSVAALQEAARLLPEDAGSSYNLAVALFQAGRLPEARVAAQRTLALNPEHTNAPVLLERIDAQQPSEFILAAPETPPAGFPTLDGATEANPGWAPLSGAEAPAPEGMAAPSTGLSYEDLPPPEAEGTPPGLGLRLLRGWLWGILYGQWWTVWFVGWGIVWGSIPLDPRGLLFVVVLAVVFGLAGSVAGIVMGAVNADDTRGALIGIVASMLLFALELAISRSPTMLVNIFFWFFTGRFVGSGLVGKVQQPVRS